MFCIYNLIKMQGTFIMMEAQAFLHSFNNPENMLSWIVVCYNWEAYLNSSNRLQSAHTPHNNCELAKGKLLTMLLFKFLNIHWSAREWSLSVFIGLFFYRSVGKILRTPSSWQTISCHQIWHTVQNTLNMFLYKSCDHGSELNCNIWSLLPPVGQIV